MRNYPDIAEQYLQRVLSGEELVCRRVKLAVQRHYSDLERAKGDDFPYYFDPEGATTLCRLFEAVQPSKWPQPMVMAPWQVAHDYILYGWKQKEPVNTGTKAKPVTLHPRRFRVAYDRWPRKTGKSARASVQSLYHLLLDGERGAEVYSAALVEEQARRVFDEAVAMRDGTPPLRREILKVGDTPCRRLRVSSSASEFRPLSRDKESMEGLNISFAVGDEVHKWPGRHAYDVIRYGMRSRVQPLFQLITTAPASDDTTSVCNTLDNYAEKVLTGVIDDQRFFAWVLEIDGEIKDADGNVIQPADRWDDETVWVKACPNLGITVKLEDMRQEALEAANDPEALNAFKRYSLNIRVGALGQAIQTETWDRCSYNADGLRVWAAYNTQGLERLDARILDEWILQKHRGRVCFAALDLAQTDDTSSLALVFPPMAEGEAWELVPFFWIPEDSLPTIVNKRTLPYDVWREQGYLVMTPGAVTDYDFIAAQILDFAKLFDLRELAYDPALAQGLVKKVLEGGFKKDRVVKFAQTMLNYASPSGDFVRAVARRELRHSGHPVLRWQISNLRWLKNHTGLVMPDKKKSVEKIDGVVASIMAYGRATHPDNAKLIKPKPKVTVL